jgi:guanidinopropionase
MTETARDNAFFQPVSGMVMPRFSAPATFMRLPYLTLDDPKADAADIALVGIPWDGGTTNRPGARHGPRQIRDLSTMIRRMHPVTRYVPFEAANVADFGDVSVNPADLQDTLQRVTAFYRRLDDRGLVPISVGGDHLTSLPVLRALAAKRPVGTVHFDSHTDLNDSYFGGCKYTHGTPFRRGIEEGLIDPKRMVQVGIRGTMYDGSDYDYAERVGARLIMIEEFRAKGVEAVMAEVNAIIGEGPVYVTFDIDFIDPAYAPGTGTPEIGGPTTFEAQQCVRALSGLDIVGADLVEVAPPFDASGGTAFIGSSILFELLCVTAKALEQRRRG